MKYLLLTLLLISSSCCYSAIYMQTDKNGNVSYTDTPTSNAVQIDNSNSTQPESATNKKADDAETLTSNPSSPPHKPYIIFSIQNPVDQQTFQNQREIPVQLRASPLLQKGDKIQVYLDGLPTGEPLPQSLFMLHQLDRGTHKINAVLLSKDMRILKQTDSIVIYIHYAHLGVPGPS